MLITPIYHRLRGHTWESQNIAFPCIFYSKILIGHASNRSDYNLRGVNRSRKYLTQMRYKIIYI